MKIHVTKLFELPRGVYFKCLSETTEPPNPTIYKFHTVDGMYSYCTDPAGNVVHLAAWTHVEQIDDPNT